MAAPTALAFRCGVYRTKDPIKNFKIRVKLEKLKPTAIEGGGTSRSDNELEMRELSNVNPTSLETEEFVFSWQEKIFSQREYQSYSNESQCTTALELKFNQMVKGLKEKGRPTRRLFSYINDDVAQNLDLIESTMWPPPAEEASTLRRRQNAKIATRDREGEYVKIPTTNIVNYAPQKADRDSNAVNETMLIMADLGFENSDIGEGNGEALLVTISTDGHGALVVKPDFSHGRKPYAVERGFAARGLYRYTIELASVNISAEEKEQEEKMFRDLYTRHSRLLSTYVGHKFHEPPNEILQLYIFGEIVSAKGFLRNGIYVNFFVELPQDWTSEGENPLFGVTQTCATKCEYGEEVAHFSFPFQHRFICPLESLTNANTGNLPRWPQLCFQVMSRDSWNRFRTEGYGYVNLPTTPGTRTYHVHTWRPVNTSLDSRLRDFFVGSSPELQDLSITAVNPALQQMRMSKYGMHTESSGGYVSIRIHAVQQCQEFSSSDYRQKLDHLSGKFSSSALQTSVTAVLEAFQRARRRMFAARENLRF